MRESRTYGSGRGACHEMHVPTATQASVRDSIKASSRVGLHPKAGHMTASDLNAARKIISCQAGAIHT